MTDARDARSEIFARIRSVYGSESQTGRESQAAAEAAWLNIPRQYRQAGTLAPDSCIDRFVDRLDDYGAAVYLSAPFDLAKTLAQVLRAKEKKRILVPPGVDRAWLREDCGCEFVIDDALSYAEMDACDGVLTGCAVAIAGTGTIALCHDAEHGRRAVTLIPDYHLCVVLASNIVETVPQAVRNLEPWKTQPITLISGPSATADIEMTRIQGVHGPRALDVVIVS